MTDFIYSTIKCEPNPEIVSYMFPLTEFNNWSQLIVKEGQEAYVQVEGQFSGPYKPGTYTLNSRNFPIFKELLSMLGSGISPFQSYVYFVNKLPYLKGLWTVNKVRYIYPFNKEFENRSLYLDFYGNLAISIEDPRKFLTELAFNRERFLTGALIFEMKRITREVVKQRLAQTLQNEKIDIFNIDCYWDILSRAILEDICPIYARYGIRIDSFTVDECVSEDFECLKERVIERQDELFVKKTEQEVAFIDAATKMFTALVEANTKAREQVISAKGDSEKIVIDAKAHGEEKVIQAEAEAKNTRITAEAEKYKILQEADAHYQEIIKMSAAEKERYKNLETDRVTERSWDNRDILAQNKGVGAVSSIFAGAAVAPTIIDMGKKLVKGNNSGNEFDVKEIISALAKSGKSYQDIMEFLKS